MLPPEVTEKGSAPRLPPRPVGVLRVDPAEVSMREPRPLPAPDASSALGFAPIAVTPGITVRPPARKGTETVAVQTIAEDRRVGDKLDLRLTPIAATPGITVRHLHAKGRRQ
jgi:hypothetical protein